MIGLFIGSFNPPTLAHLNICLNLKSMFSKIIFIPVNTNLKYLVSMENRINMLSYYTKKYSFLEIDDIMKNYSYFDYRILDLLKKKYLNITIIMGSDLFNNLDKFNNYEYLIKNYSFIIVTRDNIDIESIINNKYKDYKKHFKIVRYNSDISSTKARDLIKKKENIKDILDKDVAFYIEKHNLYF